MITIYYNKQTIKQTQTQSEDTIPMTDELMADYNYFAGNQKDKSLELIQEVGKVPYLVKYQLDEDGNRYSHYLDELDEDGYRLPDLEKIEAIKKEAEQKVIKQEAQAYINDTGWIWEKYKRNVEVLQNITKEEFLEKYQEVINKQEECRKLL